MMSHGFRYGPRCVGGSQARNDNCGHDAWHAFRAASEHITDLLPCTGANQGGYDLEGIADIQFHPNDPQHMLFHGLGFHHWVSTDFGKTFKVR